VFRPRFFDQLCVALLVLSGLMALVLAGLSLRGPTATTFHCDRASQACEAYFPSLFGGDRYEYPLATLRTSQVIDRASGEASWMIDRTTGPLHLGQDSKQPEIIAGYRHMAADLQAFLNDPTRPAFDASFTLQTHAPVAALVIVGLVMALLGFRWWRGWAAELELDRTADTLTIHRRPMFFTGPRRVTLPRRELRLREAVQLRYVGKGQRAKFARFELRDARGRRVFAYATLYDAKSRATLDGYLATLGAFCQPTG
jgi:hypothetical protein